MVTQGSKLATGLVLGAVFAGSVVAGGPRSVNGAGEPLAWDTVAPIEYNPDQGALGQLDNAAARALVAEAFFQWGTSFVVSFNEGVSLPLDVNASGTPLGNPAHYRNFYRVEDDGRSPVIFDTDGSIIDSLFGVGARFEILGLAGLDTTITADPIITGGSILINGAFHDGVGEPASPEDVTLGALRAVIMHEIGHFLNLDHSVVNHELASDGNAGNDIYVPTMYPVEVTDEEALATLNPDDVMALRMLYDQGPTGPVVSGSVFDAAGTPFQGAQVVLRHNLFPLLNAYGVISGGLHFPCHADTACNPCTSTGCPANPPAQGTWSATFLMAGSYDICVSQIDTRIALSNDTYVGPLATPPILPGPEECWTTDENTGNSDDPDDIQTISGTQSGVDLRLNAIPVTDAHEPNNTLLSGAALEDLGTGSDTSRAVLTEDDLDVYNVPVVAGQRVRVDIDAEELGSPLDAVVGFYNAAGVLVASVDDALDPDSRGFSFDPALELVAGFTGTGRIVVSSFPDLDQDGADGGTSGGYWIHVEVATDTDGDGAANGVDVCPTTAGDDADRDNICFGTDNCPTEFNPTQDAPYKLNGALVAGGSVTGYSITADDTHVIYIADQATNEVFQVYSVPIGGGTAVRLNANFGASARDVSTFRMSPDGATVVYLADQDVDETFELYSVPVAGGASTQLNVNPVAGGDVLEFAITPDGARVVFRADQDVNGIDELFSVPIGGGTVTQLHPAFVAGGSMVDPPPGLSSFLFSEDGTRVVYEADQDTLGQFELYSVPVTGGGTTKLNGTLIAAGDAFNFELDEINARVLFTADADVDELYELYAVPLAGGSVTKLSGTMPGGSAGVADFLITPDSTRAIYRAAQDTVGRLELYSVSVNGGGLVKLNTSLVAGGNVDGYGLPSGIDDGNRLVYGADQDVDEVFELYSVPLGGGNVIELNPPLVAGGNVTAFGPVVDSTVIYVADQETDERFEVYTTPAAGGEIRKISGSMQANGDFIELRYTATKVAIRMDKDADEVVELYGSHMQGGVPLKLNSSMVTGGDVVQAGNTRNLSPGTLVYRADQEVDGRFELYARTYSLDRDADGVDDRCDICPVAANAGQADADDNGIGDACGGCALGLDPDADGVCGPSDNCPAEANLGQFDFDGDGAGDACDTDDDDDGLADVVETDTGTFVDEDDTGSDPFDADTDDDGLDDGAEVEAGADPLAAASQPLRVPFAAPRLIFTLGGSNFVLAADIDGDGDLDVLVSAAGEDRISWFENDGASPPGWTARGITSAADDARSVQAADVDRDGDLDVISASSADDKVAWYENDGTPLDGGWVPHFVTVDPDGPGSGQGAADGAVSVFAADLNRDGMLDLVSASSNDHKIAWYENLLDEAGPPPAGFGSQQVLSTGAQSPSDVYAADVDGDGDTDVLSASLSGDMIAWHENRLNEPAPPPSGFDPLQEITVNGATDPTAVRASDVDGDGDLDVLSASVNDDQVAWYENDGTPGGLGDWVQHVITATAAGARSLIASDLDADGDVDVLTASQSDNTIGWHENRNGAGTFGARSVLSTTAAGACSVFAADIDGDGDLDALSASQTDGKIAWYENRMIHRNAAFPAEAVISTGFVSWVWSVAAADMDADGDVDVLSASANDDKIAWYESNGASPPAFIARAISVDFSNGARSLVAADVNRDGHMDVVSASWDLDEDEGRVAWYENDGGAPPTWTPHAVVTTTQALGHALSVVAADVDGDGDPDILSAWGAEDRIVWHENLDGAGTFGVEQAIHVFNGLGVQSIVAADVDGDGDADAVSGSRFGNKVAWYENTTGDGSLWTEHGVSGIVATPFTSVFAADVDGDGDTDVLSASEDDDEVAWYENDGTPGTGNWTARHIATLDFTRSVFATDMDGDGDMDVFSASEAEDKLAWYENDGASPPVWSEHLAVHALSYAVPIFAADLDGDRDPDLLSAEWLDSKIAWYENRGGQFTLTTSTPAGLPSSLKDGTTAAVLSIELTSNGRAGDDDVELATLELLVDDGAGDALSSAEANALIGRLRIYLDSGSGTFEPGNDLHVTTVETLELSPQVIELAAGDPRVRVGPGQSKTFFVVVEIAQGASAASPPSFRMRHVAEAGSTARSAVTGELLDIERTPNSGTGAILIDPDTTPPVITGMFPPPGTVDVSPATEVVLFASEPVDPATAVLGVSVSIGGSKVPGAIVVAPDGMAIRFDPESALELSSVYHVQVTAALTDRAGNPAVPFATVFDTTSNGGVGTIGAGGIGQDTGGATLGGGNDDDDAGFAAAAVGDVNGDGVSDLLIGAPNADLGGAATDAGRVRLVFGAPSLQSNGAALSLSYTRGVADEHVGESVARAGDLDHDGTDDLLIGVPRSNVNGTDAGAVYVVFGDTQLDELGSATVDLDNLPSCSTATSCGVLLLGALGDSAGTAISAAGDLNNDGFDDLAIGAPGATLNDAADTGRVYVLYGPLGPGTIDLADVGTVTAPGLVFTGENGGDRAGSSVSPWEDVTGDGVDDLLIGAPGATTLDPFGDEITEAGWVYAVHGGTSAGHLTDETTPGVIDLGRVASGGADQVSGVVFLGAESQGHIGRTVTGEVDTDGNGTLDVLISGDGKAFAIPGDGPKSVSGGSRTGGTLPSGNGNMDPVQGLLRSLGDLDTLEDFQGVLYEGEDEEDPLTIGPAGDVNNDGVDDFIVGSPFADGAAGEDVGQAYLIFGSPAPGGGERSLSDVGETIAGLTLEGAEAGDNLGSSVGGGADLNADGVDDALVGAPFAEDNGETYVISPVNPQEVVLVRLSPFGGATLIEWTVTDFAESYNVYRGTLAALVANGELRTSAMIHLACGIDTNLDGDLLPDTSDADVPSPGEGFTYLVTAMNPAGEGPLGPAGATPVPINDNQCP